LDFDGSIISWDSAIFGRAIALESMVAGQHSYTYHMSIYSRICSEYPMFYAEVKNNIFLPVEKYIHIRKEGHLGTTEKWKFQFFVGVYNKAMLF
jgi:hypothetical protein